MNGEYFTAENVDIEHYPYRHVDVDLYYRLGEVDKAQEIARELRPVVVSVDKPLSDETLERIRERFREADI